jgi:ribosomal protein L11 methyltransferase
VSWVTVRVADREAREAAYDLILPRVPAGAHETRRDDGGYDLAFRTDERDWLAGLDWRPGAPPARGWTVAGRFHVRRAQDPPPPEHLIDLVVGGGFGDGSHPTTRACLALLAQLEPRGAFADLGCGSGVLALAAQRLGFAPVLALDADAGAVDAARGAGVDARVADLLAEAPPGAPAFAANVPIEVHERLAATTPARAAVVAGFAPGRELLAQTLYEEAGFTVAARLEEGGWTALRLAR